MKAATVISGLALTWMLGCGASPQNLSNKTNRQALTADQTQKHTQLVTEGDALWKERSDRAKLQGALARWEQAVALKDDDWKTYAKLARGYYFYADAFLAFDAMGGAYPYDPGALADQKANTEFLNTHLRGIEHAEKGLAALSPEYEKRLLSGIRPEDAVVLIDRTGIELVYWYASNLGKWAKAKGFSTILEHKDRIFKLVSHVYETAPDYFHGAADRYFGAFYAVAPAFAGGDLDKSKTHFDASIKAAPKYLGSYVLAAELYATKAQAPEAFDQLLAYVESAPADALPDVAPENQVEKRKAKALVAKKAELF